MVIGGFLFLTKPTYMRPLYTTHVGEFMLAGAFVLLVLGTLLMRQMIKLEV